MKRKQKVYKYFFRLKKEGKNKEEYWLFTVSGWIIAKSKKEAIEIINNHHTNNSAVLGLTMVCKPMITFMFSV